MNNQYKLSDKYKFINQIYPGSFGDVYLVQDKNKNKYVAKTELKNNPKLRLFEEYKIYQTLNEKGLKTGILKIKEFIETNKRNILVTQLLGKNLDELHQTCHNKFDIVTVLKIGIEIITLLENLHNVGFILRNIKPNNFITNYNDEIINLCINDLTLSKQFIVYDKHIDIDIDVKKNFIGTARYASINTHLGIESSRRDDLESVGYMLIYFLQGKLPWQDLKSEKHENTIKLIGNTKINTGLRDLCEGLPNCFTEYIKYCRNLNFEELPNYKYLRSLFSTELGEQIILREQIFNKKRKLDSAFDDFC